MISTINYTCECGKTWKHSYEGEIKGRFLHLDRIVATGTPPHDALCSSCGKHAEATLDPPMPGLAGVFVRLLCVVPAVRYSEEEQERHYEEIVQRLIAWERGCISWDRLEAIEAQAATLVEQGLTPDAWDALSNEQRAALLGGPAE